MSLEREGENLHHEREPSHQSVRDLHSNIVAMPTPDWETKIKYVYVPETTWFFDTFEAVVALLEL